MKLIKVSLLVILTLAILGSACNKEKPGDITVTLSFVNEITGDVSLKIFASEDDQINGVVMQEQTVSFSNTKTQAYTIAEIMPKTYILEARALIDGTDYFGSLVVPLESKEEKEVTLALSGNGSINVLVKADGNYVCNASVSMYESEAKRLIDDHMAKGKTGPTNCDTDGALFKNLALAQYSFTVVWTSNTGTTYYGARDGVWANKDEVNTITIKAVE